ncbi:MAG: transglutaminase domain-containing protein [bacterium]
MKIFRLLLTLLILSFLSAYTSPTHVLADSEFSTNFTSSYEVLETGSTNVRHQVQIINNLSHIYTTDYSIVIGENNLTNVKVTSGGLLAPEETTTSENTTTLNIKIPNPVVGKDRITDLDISYTSENIAEHNGNIWEINIPKLSKANEAKSFTRTITFPNSLSKPTIVSPRPTNITQNSINNQTTYSYNGFPTDSITLLFGTSQLYELDLTYNITNPSRNTSNTEIALPLDTDYQRVTLDSIVPPPSEIKLDSDQNWLAVYSLSPDQTLDVKAKVYIEIFPTPTLNYSPNLANLTSPQKYWETKNTTISSLGVKLKSPQNIYNYLLNNYSYSYARVGVGSERLGALKALSSPGSAICTEFTDTFIALARAIGIPAREINGYAHTTNDLLRPLELATDVLHAWPEYYDETSGHWIQVDPTWGNTTGGIDYFSKMDFNHLAFVRHGQEPDYPYPPGAYKQDSRDKTVNVKIVENIPSPTPSFALSNSDSKTVVTNTGNVALHDYPITLEDGSSYQINYLPPFGHETISPKLLPKLSFFEHIYNFLKNLFAPH